MKIEWTLYEEEGIDPDDPLGTIVLSDDEGNEIRQEATYLDSWFEALIEGLRSLQAGEEEAVEILEEPDPLEFRMVNDGVEIRHDLAQIKGGSLSEFEEMLQRELDRFLEVMRLHEGWEGNGTLRHLADILELD
jgi:hypothetical protein